MTTRFRPAEMVLPGHPDKLADAIADSIVEQAARREQRALCGVEVAVHRSHVFVTGRVAARDAETIDISTIAREVFASAGYGSRWSPDPDELIVTTNLCLEELNPGEADFRAFSDDQSIVTGYAIDLPGANYLPPEHWLVHQMGRRLHTLRFERPELGLGPDGKLMIVLAESEDSLAIHTFSASLQQHCDGSTVELVRSVRETVEDVLIQQAPRIPKLKAHIPEEFLVNAAGNFSIGGTEGDNGLSGKKLVVDAYGPRIPIGGGALSGKDFYKADRAGAIIARRLAKAVVMTGPVRECFVAASMSPGDTSVHIHCLEDEKGNSRDVGRWSHLLDLSLDGCGNAYACTPGLTEIARWGHFSNDVLPWEKISFST